MAVDKRVKGLVRRGFRSIGLTVSRAPDPRAAAEGRLWRRNERDERHLVALLAACLRPDSSCIDVGANLGGFTEVMVRLAPGGRHVAVEPIPHLAASIRDRFPSVEVYEAVLGDRTCTCEFGYVPDAPALSGLEPTARPSYEIQTLSIDMLKLDDVAVERRIAFIKIDVEGAELGVLSGAVETLRRSRPVVVFEHSRMEFDAGLVPVVGRADSEKNRAIFDLLVGEMGYRLFDLDGAGPLGCDDFRELYETVERFNFLAVPSFR